MHYNTGYQKEAFPLMQHFLEVFRGAEIICVPSASCVAMIREHFPVMAADSADPKLLNEVNDLLPRVFEFTELLVDKFGVTTKDYAAIAREYQHSGKLDLQSRLDLFAERLRDYGAGVHRCSSSGSNDQISSTIGEVLAGRGIHCILVPPGIPASWLTAADIEFVPGDGLTYDEMDRMEGVLTACTAAIALTGTILLRHSPNEGSRVLTLIPDYHLCVVFENQVLETVPEAIRQMEPFSTLPITTISGPSATSDIEMTRIKGVHGPRILDVILTKD
jgi:L-lactate dehydrogenase complex protein LldG